MGGHSTTRVEINSEVADNGHHSIQKLSFNFCCLFVRTGWSCGENMSFPHKEKHTSDTSDNSFYCFRYCAPPFGYGAFSNHACRTSVCLSVASIVSNSRTQRPSKIKIGTEVTPVTCDSGISFEVKGCLLKLVRIHSFSLSFTQE